MKRKSIPLFLLGITAILLSTCRMDAGATLTVSSLVDAKNRALPATCAATISFPKPDDAMMPRIIELLGDYFLQPANIREGEGEDSSILLADVRVPLVFGNGAAGPASLLSIVVDEDDTSRPVSIRLDKELFASLNAGIIDLTMEETTIRDLGFSVRLDNDTDGTVRIRTAASYVDSMPRPFPAVIEVASRQAVDIVPSDVLRDTLLDGDRLSVFALLK